MRVARPAAGRGAEVITVVIVVTVIATLRSTGVAQRSDARETLTSVRACGVVRCQATNPIAFRGELPRAAVAYPNVILVRPVLPAPARASTPAPRFLGGSSSACPPPARPASAQTRPWGSPTHAAVDLLRNASHLFWRGRPHGSTVIRDGRGAGMLDAIGRGDPVHGLASMEQSRIERSMKSRALRGSSRV